jgi:ribosomal protein S18 acetylase RimI-like enzyme
VVSVSVPDTSTAPIEGLRPVNLRTDLGALADLIELAFSDSMDSSGRAAVREMRTLSRMGPGLNVLAGVNELTQGIALGYVWIKDGKLVGNVSVYPANWPANLGTAWIIANVAVHPDYRGQGIASALMEASLNMIRERGSSTAILQVEQDNWTARRLYERLGFVGERAWIHWRRSSTTRIPLPLDNRSVYITQQRRGEWRAEYELAERLRPAELGGVGWLKPLHVGLFRKPLWNQVSEWISLRSTERLVIRSEDQRSLLASMWIESGFASSSVQLTLMVEPDFQGLYDEALINLAVRRYGTRQPLIIEHPASETTTNLLLQQYQFRPQRTLVHMHWDARR